MKILNPSYQRYENVLRILQTGAICKLDNSVFFKKDGEAFIQFALKYLYQDTLPDQNQEQKAKLLAISRELTKIALSKAQGNYFNLIEQVQQLVTSIKPGSVPDPRPIFESYQPLPDLYTGIVSKMASKYGVKRSICILQLLFQYSVPLPTHLFHSFIEIENAFIKRENIERYEGQAVPPDSEFFEYFSKFKDHGWKGMWFESRGSSEFEQNLAFQFETLYNQKLVLTQKIHNQFINQSQYSWPEPLIKPEEVLDLLSPLLIMLPKKSV